MADIFARLEIRTGTLAAWTSANPILSAGEPGYEVDTGVLRMGDGSTPFLSLERFQTSDGFAATFQPLADNLTAFSGLTFAANTLPYGTGIGSFALTDLTAEARVFLAAATKAAQRTSLGLTAAAITDVDASTNMTLNPTRLPTRAAVGGAILATGGPAKRVAFTASGTFVKADQGAYPADHMVLVEVWGGGGGGSSFAGGGGGGYNVHHLRYADIPTTVAIAIGAGGSIANNGGNTTFGTLMTGLGGLAGGADGGAGGGFGGGKGGTGAGSQGQNGDRANSIWGGGGGGGNGTIGGNGGEAAFGGGGGGGGATGGLGGVSLRAGNGGASNAAGQIPAGGGGRNAAGARGEVRIWL